MSSDGASRMAVQFTSQLITQLSQARHASRAAHIAVMNRRREIFAGAEIEGFYKLSRITRAVKQNS